MERKKQAAQYLKNMKSEYPNLDSMLNETELELTELKKYHSYVNNKEED